jgi:hypothetical protein
MTYVETEEFWCKASNVAWMAASSSSPVVGGTALGAFDFGVLSAGAATGFRRSSRCFTRPLCRVVFMGSTSAW